MVFKPISPKKISSQIAEQIRSSILAGEFYPGEKLPPEHLRQLSGLGGHQSCYSRRGQFHGGSGGGGPSNRLHGAQHELSSSPIRRYPDVMVHRLLARYLEDGRSVQADQ